MKYIAVVWADRASLSIGKGNWASFVSEDKDEAIRLALAARRKWGDRDYEVLVGVLSEKASEPITYRLKKL